MKASDNVTVVLFYIFYFSLSFKRRLNNARALLEQRRMENFYETMSGTSPHGIGKGKAWKFTVSTQVSCFTADQS